MNKKNISKEIPLKDSSRKCSLSLVLPCHNEYEVLDATYKRLNALIGEWKKTLITKSEIVLVNNGSTDNTIKKMLEIKAVDSSVVVVDLRNNYGYQGSISAGLAHTTGDMVVTIDADLQDPPEKISEMIEAYYQGYELVLGIRESRGSDGFFKRHTAQLYYRILNVIGVRSVYNHGEFRLMSRQLVDCFNQLVERNRFIRSMVLDLESHYACVYYDRDSRTQGVSKFKIRHLCGLAIDGITSFSSAPVRMVSVLGIVMFLSSLVAGGYVLVVKFTTANEVPGWAFLSVILLFFGGMNSLSIGIVGEYISKTYNETKQRPVFLVRKLYR